MEHNTQKQWELYRDQELLRVRPLLHSLNIELDETQPHIQGERYLMSGKKLVLLGTLEGKRVVIKISSEREGIGEIEHEHKVSNALRDLPFAYLTLFSPRELLFTHTQGFCILVTEYITQEKNFLQRNTPEQFSLLLSALKSQEGAHVTTNSHARMVRQIFEVWDAERYLSSFKKTKHEAQLLVGDEQRELLNEAENFLTGHTKTIEQYSGFLTHTDFVPHNIRTKGNVVYLLDHTSLHFGNKYESWARLINFMLLYNRELHDALLTYVRENRSSEEYLSLRLMRVYKLVFLLAFYAKNVERSTGDLQQLSRERVTFWSKVLRRVLADTPVPEEWVEEYTMKRDALRSHQEMERQKELH